MMWSIYEIIHICTAVVDESEECFSQWIFQLQQLEREAWKKIRASKGFEPVTSTIPVWCSTNWAMRPHIGSEVNYLSSNLAIINVHKLTLTIILSDTLAHTKYSLFFVWAYTATTSKKYLQSLKHTTSQFFKPLLITDVFFLFFFFVSFFW